MRNNSSVFQFGLISDIHKDVIHDADGRLRTFIQSAQTNQVDFILQMGDFCIPIPENLPFLDIWYQFEGPKYHVLGNHDMDGDGHQKPDGAYAFTPEETMTFWGMPTRYYAFDHAGVHFIILDGNDKPVDPSGYYEYIAPDQIDWLKSDLTNTDLPVIIFCHQNLARQDGLVNQPEVHAVFDGANKQVGKSKIIACFTGHDHRDYVRQLDGIIYAQINSASYHWLGGDYICQRYSQKIDVQYPYIKYTLPYRNALYAIVTVNMAERFIKIEGIESEFVGPPPWELDDTPKNLDTESLNPAISGWQLSF
ncbi:TPA: alkaline phosphatase [Candidatus Poribacteria bacterium]|nr:alkaline phosphatase [Candidatus Poribacteria bacterium]HIA70148.1 alkaline phosphatase [Candidatus Poribacteria bacterium]HIB89483.1 alkaline phosphatase [Candidatus Poribacteria bacterium]HIC19019.1 alkaline phosphatase [Candidatus Poribacteria bacterium]HIN28904.1 alkaline phosphatase [Candidatus Poribacteria bacterium]